MFGLTPTSMTYTITIDYQKTKWKLETKYSLVPDSGEVVKSGGRFTRFRPFTLR